MIDIGSPLISKMSPHSIDASKVSRTTVVKPDVDDVYDIVCKRIFDSKTEMETCEEDNAFFIADHNELRRQHLKWISHLPRVEPFYGMNFSSFILLPCHEILTLI